MALSRIWSAFIIVAVLVAASKWLIGGDNQIFSRMVVGKSDDPYDSVYYTLIGAPQKGSITKEGFAKYLAGYGYVKSDSLHPAGVVITDNAAVDSVALFKANNPSVKVYSYTSIQSKLVKKADGI